MIFRVRCQYFPSNCYGGTWSCLRAMSAVSRRTMSTMPRRSAASSVRSQRSSYIDVAIPSRKGPGLRSNQYSTQLEEHQKINRIDGDEISSKEFSHLYDAAGKPCIIDGLTKAWAATALWTTRDALAKTCGSSLFQYDGEIDADVVRPLETLFREIDRRRKHSSELPSRNSSSRKEHGEDTVDFAEIHPDEMWRLHWGHDRVPYIFDALFDIDCPSLLQHYSVPHLFAHDMLSHCQMKETGRRPHYRWLLIGGHGSGSLLHVDPLVTNAWNAVVKGTKQWLLLPPSTPQQLIESCEPSSLLQLDADQWFHDRVPKLLDSLKRRELPYLHFEQHAGQTVFIPSGWHHAVLNMDEDYTIAVTHNFASPANAQAALKAFHASQ